MVFGIEVVWKTQKRFGSEHIDIIRVPEISGESEIRRKERLEEKYDSWWHNLRFASGYTRAVIVSRRYI